MKELAYIAGPLRGHSHFEVRDNIRMAEMACRWALDQGYIPICPHLMWGPLLGYKAEEFMMAACLKVLSVCDVIVMIPGWADSEGSILEYHDAKEMPKIHWDPCKGGTIPRKSSKVAYEILDRACADFTD